jgi:hypothetical protein
LIVSMVRKIGNPIGGSEKLNIRVTSTTAQKTGSASSFAKAPDVPFTSAAPKVTKFPVTWAVNNPCSAKNPAVSTKPAFTLNRIGSVGFMMLCSHACAKI